jgi:hypothetical protein
MWFLEGDPRHAGQINVVVTGQDPAHPHAGRDRIRAHPHAFAVEIPPA